MPIYEYICGKCGKRFDKRQSFDEKPVALCPSCNGDSKRLISCVPVIFKGSGFYVTDYKKENACVTPAADKEPPAAVTSDTKKETTPVASTEAKSPESRKSESKTQESKKDSKTTS